MFCRACLRCGGRVLAAAAVRAAAVSPKAFEPTVRDASSSVAAAAPVLPVKPYGSFRIKSSDVDNVFVWRKVDTTVLRSAQADSSGVVLPAKAHVVLIDCTAAKSSPSAGSARIASNEVLRCISFCLEKMLSPALADLPAKQAAVWQAPLVVAVQSALSPEDAEMQQLVLRNALLMNPFCQQLKFTDPVVWVMTDDETTTFRRVASDWLASANLLGAPSTTSPAATVAGAEVSSPPSSSISTDVSSKTDETTTMLPPPSAATSGPASVPAEQPATASLHGAVVPPSDNKVDSVSTATTTVAEAASLHTCDGAACVSAPSQSADVLSLAARVHEVEKEVWRSFAEAPMHLSMLRPLLDDVTYASLTYKMALLAPAELHVLVYRLGCKSHLHAAFRECLFSLGDFYHDLTGSTSLAQTATAMAQLALSQADDVASVSNSVASMLSALRERATAAAAGSATPNSESPSSTSLQGTARNGPDASATTTTAAVEDANAAAKAQPPRRCLCLLLHTSHVTGGDVEVLQRQVQSLYAALPAAVQSTQLLAVQVLTSDSISEKCLCYALKHSTTATVLSPWSLTPTATTRRDDGEGSDGSYSSGSGNDTSTTLFASVYRRLCEAAATSTLPLQLHAHEHAPSPPASALRPGALVTQAAWLATLVQELLSSREACIRKELDGVYASMRRQQASDEELARAAQKVELKALMTDIVEEVALRHEQATAHLVKTLSSMVGQWSADKFTDGLQTTLRAQVTPLQQATEDCRRVAEAHTTQLGDCATRLQKVRDQLERVAQRTLTREQVAEVVSSALRASDADRTRKSKDVKDGSSAAAVAASAEAARTVLATAVREAVQGSLSTLTQRLEVAVQRAVEQHMRSSQREAGAGGGATTTLPAPTVAVDKDTLASVVEATVTRLHTQQQQQQQQQGQVQRQRVHRRGAWYARKRVAQSADVRATVDAQQQQQLSSRALHEAVSSAMQPLMDSVQQTLRTCVRDEVARALQQRDGTTATTSSSGSGSPSSSLPPNMRIHDDATMRTCTSSASVLLDVYMIANPVSGHGKGRALVHDLCTAMARNSARWCRDGGAAAAAADADVCRVADDNGSVGSSPSTSAGVMLRQYTASSFLASHEDDEAHATTTAASSSTATVRCSVVLTEHRGDGVHVAKRVAAAAVARQLQQAPRDDAMVLVVAVGGDGTLSEVVNGLCEGTLLAYTTHVQPLCSDSTTTSSSGSGSGSSSGGNDALASSSSSSCSRPCDTTRALHTRAVLQRLLPPLVYAASGTGGDFASTRLCCRNGRELVCILDALHRRLRRATCVCEQGSSNSSSSSNSSNSSSSTTRRREMVSEAAQSNTPCRCPCHPHRRHDDDDDDGVTVHCVDVGRVLFPRSGAVRYFVNECSLGLSCDVVQLVERLRRHRVCTLAGGTPLFALAAVVSVLQLRPRRLRVARLPPYPSPSPSSSSAARPARCATLTSVCALRNNDDNNNAVAAAVHDVAREVTWLCAPAQQHTAQSMTRDVAIALRDVTSCSAQDHTTQTRATPTSLRAALDLVLPSSPSLPAAAAMTHNNSSHNVANVAEGNKDRVHDVVTTAHALPPVLAPRSLRWVHMQSSTLVFGNGRCFGGGLHITPHGDPTDGLLSCTSWVASFATFVLRFPALYTGAHVRWRHTTTFDGSRFLVDVARDDEDGDGDDEHNNNNGSSSSDDGNTTTARRNVSSAYMEADGELLEQLPALVELIGVVRMLAPHNSCRFGAPLPGTARAAAVAAAAARSDVTHASCDGGVRVDDTHEGGDSARHTRGATALRRCVCATRAAVTSLLCTCRRVWRTVLLSPRRSRHRVEQQRQQQQHNQRHRNLQQALHTTSSSSNGGTQCQQHSLPHTRRVSAEHTVTVTLH